MQGRQAYIIYPLVEESEKVDLKAATEMADHLSQDVFPEYRVALLHGRMKPDAKDRVMGGFARGRIRHPGLDHRDRSRRRRAERHRHGHRARGALRAVAAPPAPRPRRPRRSTSRTASCCTSRRSPSRARERLKALTETTDGFEIAERDLAAARPGRLLRHAPVRSADAAGRRSPARSRRHGGGPPRGGRGAGRPHASISAVHADQHIVGAAVRAHRHWMTDDGCRIEAWRRPDPAA